MARYDGKFQADGAEPIGLGELLRLLEAGAPLASPLERARACYLSSSDGWREAVKQLGGAFADDAVVDATDEK